MRLAYLLMMSAMRVHELRGMLETRHGFVYPKDELFVSFDKFWMGWDPAQDALRLAADLVNDDEFPRDPTSIAARYDWSPRRLNPAIAFLSNRNALQTLGGMGTAPYGAAMIRSNDATRRFVRSRS